MAVSGWPIIHSVRTRWCAWCGGTVVVGVVVADIVNYRDFC
jgi:hypothetical protein